MSAIVDAKAEETPKVEPPPAAAAFSAAAAVTEEAPKAAAEENDAGVVEEEATAVFQPLVSLEEVETVSGEEGEDTVLSLRGKLYRYTETLLDKGTGKKQWIERGVGDIKLLTNRDTEQQRFLMRQEKTLKLIVNTLIDPRIRMTKMDSNDKTWVWTCYDFSDAEIVEEVFAFKCTSVEDAATFKEAFDKSQSEMKALLEGKDKAADPEADKAAEALEKLSAS